MRHVQRKAALVGADVQRLAARMLRRCRVVEPLIEERAGLLPGSRVVGEAQAVQQEGGFERGLCLVLRVERGQRGRLQSFERCDARVSALDDGLRRELFDENARDQLTHLRPVEPAGEHLHQEQRAVTIDDEAGQLVRFAEDEAAGLRLHGGAQRKCATQPALDQASHSASVASSFRLTSRSAICEDGL